MTYGGDVVAVIYIIIWNLVSWGPECILLRSAYHQVARLRWAILARMCIFHPTRIDWGSSSSKRLNPSVWQIPFICSGYWGYLPQENTCLFWLEKATNLSLHKFFLMQHKWAGRFVIPSSVCIISYISQSETLLCLYVMPCFLQHCSWTSHHFAESANPQVQEWQRLLQSSP